MATNLYPPCCWKRSAIQLPRPPQPIRPSVIVEFASAAAAWRGATTSSPAAAAVVPARKVRRLTFSRRVE